jgi:hypothetical protein
MNQLTTQTLDIEKRRPGLWIVGSRHAASAFLWTVEIGQDGLTFEYRYTVSRLSSRSRSRTFPTVNAAFDFCRTAAGLTSAEAR